MDEGERKALSDIAAFGCHVIYVLEEEELPPFAYSVGITRSCGAPEVVVLGFKKELSHYIVNEYNRRVRLGEKFEPGSRYSGFLDGFEVEVRTVNRTHYREHFGWDIWLYQGYEFSVLQLVLPDTRGVWPWEEAAGPWFQTRQPLLDIPLAQPAA